MIKPFLSRLLGAVGTLLMCLSVSFNSHGAIIDKQLEAGHIRIHLPNQAPAQCTAVLMGVGTSMSTSSYDKLAEQISQYGHISVILDHAPGNMIKTDATRYAALANEVKGQLLSLLASSNCNSVTHWIMGGHSAGGQAAQNAVANDPTLADGIFSIDPYNAKDTQPVYVPALYWGFTDTTCFVEVEDAAKEAYERSHDKRAFIKVDSKYSWGPCGYSPTYFHCSFCDGHCPGCTNCKKTPQHFFDDVATSLDKFIHAAFEQNWSKSALQFNATTPFTLYVDGDQP